MGKVKCWTAKKLKKARAKRSLERAKKRGPIYGGYFCISDEYELRPLTEEEERNAFGKLLEYIQTIKEGRIEETEAPSWERVETLLTGSGSGNQ